MSFGQIFWEVDQAEDVSNLLNTAAGTYANRQKKIKKKRIYVICLNDFDVLRTPTKTDNLKDNISLVIHQDEQLELSFFCVLFCRQNIMPTEIYRQEI